MESSRWQIIQGTDESEACALLGGTMITAPGVYNIPMEEYHKDPCVEPSLSRSTIQDLLNSSPLHAWTNHPRLNPNFQPDDDTKYDLGTAAHSLLFEGPDAIAVIEADDWRTKAAKEERAKARTQGRIPLLRDDYELAKKMVEIAIEGIRNCKELGVTDLRKDGKAELSCFWIEKPDYAAKDIWVRVRLDWLSHDSKLILDYKTTKMSANPSIWGRTAINMGYDVQDALYTRGTKVLMGGDPKFVFIVQEAEEPFAVSFIGLPPEFMDLGKQKVDYGIFLWHEGITTGLWPGYPSKVCWVDLPGWAMLAWENKATELGVEP